MGTFKYVLYDRLLTVYDSVNSGNPNSVHTLV